MRTIIHLSDIHFGRVDYATVQPLVETVHEMAPDLVVISGDLTQRARAAQFKEARKFLESLPQPQIVVPGNHDVPLYNVVARFLAPLDNYHRYITEDMTPYYADDEIAVLGLNTARSLTFKNGRINEEQVAQIKNKLSTLKPEIVKIIVTHHPFDLPREFDQGDLVGRAEMAMETLADCGADLLLAGHYHITHTGDTAARYQLNGYAALVVQAGSATSTRIRGEANSFNVIRIDHPHVTIERMLWQRDSNLFRMDRIEHFEQGAKGWSRIPGDR